MADALERFFNWQSDQDWVWGPLLYLRPPKIVRMTLRFWLTLFGFALLFTVPVGAVLGTLLAYYDYTAAQHREKKITPVVVAENWLNSTMPEASLFACGLLLLAAFLMLFLAHWAWNRRADRLNREGLVPLPAVTAMPGVWPPPPVVSGEDLQSH